MHKVSLFNSIHDSYIIERTYPSSVQEFLDFGLTTEDFVIYLALQQHLQSEIILRRHSSSICCDNTKQLDKSFNEDNAATLLFEFCREKNLIGNWVSLHNFRCSLNYFDAIYRHGEAIIPMDINEFRLIIERKLSANYDEKEDYISYKLNVSDFEYDCELNPEWEGGFIPRDEPSRVRRYNPDTKEFDILKRDEVRKLKTIVEADIKKIENEMKEHLLYEPQVVDVKSYESTKLWIEKFYKICGKSDYLEEILEEIDDALKTPDIRIVKPSDTLNVLFGKSKAELYGYSIESTSAEFTFYSGSTQKLPIKWCSMYEEYQISWDDFNEIITQYGFPKMKIKYNDEDTHRDISGDFNETSIFYDMGYSVSESVGLTDERRQSILINIINSGKVSWYDTIKHLQQMLNINAKKAGNELAAKKWQADYDYIYEQWMHGIGKY